MDIELSPGVIILVLIGLGFGYFVSKSMHPGAFWIILSTLAGGAAGIVIGTIASNN